jgi:hypothetical protein
MSFTMIAVDARAEYHTNPQLKSTESRTPWYTEAARNAEVHALATRVARLTEYSLDEASRGVRGLLHLHHDIVVVRRAVDEFIECCGTEVMRDIADGVSIRPQQLSAAHSKRPRDPAQTLNFAMPLQVPGLVAPG